MAIELVWGWKDFLTRTEISKFIAINVIVM